MTFSNLPLIPTTATHFLHPGTISQLRQRSSKKYDTKQYSNQKYVFSISSLNNQLLNMMLMFYELMSNQKLYLCSFAAYVYLFLFKYCAQIYRIAHRALDYLRYFFSLYKVFICTQLTGIITIYLHRFLVNNKYVLFRCQKVTMLIFQV